MNWKGPGELNTSPGDPVRPGMMDSRSTVDPSILYNHLNQGRIDKKPPLWFFINYPLNDDAFMVILSIINDSPGLVLNI